ncbi:hypothetical protein [Paenibacillus donghaensis]|uniref:Uncharacterized protein n=1 Tax=Paenibacillus donghaensis TaxID=414771 RepID=A0A2Z2KQJ0_9BACL|nr:hypothetical protein [Paenibacillus donghaensis]ASA26103.1 hypothetical protein B9T62_38590 [Paenibacillus donghaensis]
MERGRDNHVGGDARAMERERSAAAAADDRYEIPSTLHLTARVEGKADTGLDTMNAGAGTAS